MLIFLDTEFTGLGQADPKLISIALVAEDGFSHHFYAEIEMGEGWGKEDCSEFVLSDVIPILMGGKHQVTRAKLKERLLAWIAKIPEAAQVACDSETDFRFLKQILGVDWPEKLDKQYFDLRPMASTPEYEKAVEVFHIDSKQPRHNSLNDAYAAFAGWIAWNRLTNPSFDPMLRGTPNVLVKHSAKKVIVGSN